MFSTILLVFILSGIIGFLLDNSAEEPRNCLLLLD